MHAIEPAVALVAIARPTFDVPLAQSVADRALEQIKVAGYQVTGTGAELIMDAEGAARAVELLAAEPFDLLVLLQASFADSTMAVELAAVASRRGVPVLLWAVPDRRDGGRLRLNSLCGINLAGHALALRNIVYDYVLAPAEDSAVVEKIGRLARVGHARQDLNAARIGVVGEYPAGFDTCAYDAGVLQKLLGVEVIAMALPQMLAQAASAAVPERRAFLERVRSFTPNLDALDGTAVEGTAGVYVALRAAVDAQGLSGLAVRCWPEFFTELGCAACGAMSMLNEQWCPASCEADVNGTVTSLLLQSLSGSQVLLTDLVSVDAQSDTAVLWHCGLAPASMADPQTGVIGTVHSNRKLPLLFEFPLKPGRVTIARLHRSADGYQLAIGGGEMVRAPKSFGGTSGVVRFDRPAADVFDTIMQAGLEHHFSIAYGDVREELRIFARMVGLPTLELT